MDDQSSEQTMVDLYRSFVGANQSGPTVDVLLGPGSFQFRRAAAPRPEAQVASEYQLPDITRAFVADFWHTLGAKDAYSSVVTSKTEAPGLPYISCVQGGLEEPGGVGTEEGRAFWAAQKKNKGYYLRAGAELLTCDGPCEADRDLATCFCL
ncbi:unnamed protein product [Symbiodinium pilosum]|uniref:Uncharacterized protein n=1 Tax=Symbiodinium pilosum TaxID=2952 RepID=A0A812ILB7_SYMPI|nr:unnamed protein product [Symbiodinium pilosum]